MKSLFEFSPRIKLNFKLLAFIFVVCLLFRIVFVASFVNGSGDYSLTDFLKAFYLGAKFDLRVSIALILPFLTLSILPKLNPICSENSKKYWLYFYSALLGVLVGFYVFDFGYYVYLQDRLNASILQFTENLAISLNMVWQSYPVIPILVGYFASTFGLSKLLKRMIFPPNREVNRYRRSGLEVGVQSLLIFILVVGGLYAKLSHYPLRWSEAFFNGNRFISATAINPLHYFFDTLVNHSKDYDLNKVKQFYPIVSAFLGVDNPDANNLNFTREQKPVSPPLFKKPPNVVVIVMESLSAHRMGLFGNQLSATPFLDELAKDSWSFNSFYTPSEGTARGIFALVTSLADINKERTSSRNPLVVDQNSVANYLTDYKRFYFIGGSANWGNIRGVLTNNIDNLNLYEEGHFQSERTDVWGISDYHLFKESHRILNENKQPFLAFIQTAGFHRPYTIPEDRGEFKLKELNMKDLKKWGFESLEEYNSLAFSDYSLNYFIEMAKKSEYFDNTIFVILGDHGLPDNGSLNLTPTMTKFSLERFHTPLVFYSPNHLKPKVIEEVVTQQDVLPTIAAMTGHRYLNKGLGRNILDKRFDDFRYSFSYVYYRNPHTIFLFDQNKLVTGTPMNVDQMYDYRTSEAPKEISKDFPEEFRTMQQLLYGLYETSKYMLYNNKKPNKLQK